MSSSRTAAARVGIRLGVEQGQFFRRKHDLKTLSTLAATLTDDALKAGLLSLAAELEQIAHRDRGVC